ncbi:MAG: ATPase, T2SS/T4P/T4SS family, partial [Patescibacteria group bacterium]
MTLEHTLEEKKRKEKYDELRKKEEETATERLSNQMEIPYANLSNYSVNAEALAVLDKSSAQRAGLCVITKNGSNLKVAVKNPKNPQTMLAVENLKNKNFIIDLLLVSETSLEKIWKGYSLLPEEKEIISGNIEITPENLAKLQQEIKYIDDFKDIYIRAALKNVTAVIELIIAGSLSLDSSDIHIEPQKEKAIIRFRIDGSLQEVAELDKKMYELLSSRIKLLSEMKINIKDTPQDGRFTITSAGNTPVEIRTSVLPGPNGESIVMRILNPKTISIALEDLGIPEYAIQIVKDELKKPNGLILVTGPTGSGKT